MLIRKAKSEQLQALEKSYLQVRAKEDRIYSDDIVKELPTISNKHVQYKEWLIRQDSLTTIQKFLKSNPQIKRVLDLGCGNGWMSNRLEQQGVEVVGVDVNRLELEQAARLFPSVMFYEIDVFENTSILGKFDAIIISSVLQYFKSPLSLFDKLKSELLLDEGKLIIADTKFYRIDEMSEAKIRSQDYYHSLDEDEMTKHYFHHTTEMMALVKAISIRNKSIFDWIKLRFKGVKNPFVIYVISK